MGEIGAVFTPLADSEGTGWVTTDWVTYSFHPRSVREITLRRITFIDVSRSSAALSLYYEAAEY